MSASEAVMVAPEQCATAPKTLASQHAAPATTSTTRLVLLAVLALAAATGAMFGAVVLGNQLTQELHPKGSSHLNSVTLVDSEDRAIATTAVESYVSLLDLPLLGTAELNKVDGITFSTYRGIEHRKVTGYTVTTETASVGDSEVQTPRLSLATSAPGATVEVSVRDNKAWLSEADDSTLVVTPIDTSSQRRLADGGSCLESGACLYSRDELLRLDAASRRLEEGSFFARADVAAYQVELSGDVMQYLENGAQAAAYLDGTFTDGGHSIRLRVEEGAAGKRFAFTNATSGKTKLVTSEGEFLFSSNGRLVRCNANKPWSGLSDLNIDALGAQAAKTFEVLSVVHEAAPADFIDVEASAEECFALTKQQANMTSAEALERYPTVANAFRSMDTKAARENAFTLESRRKLSAKATKAVADMQKQMDEKHMIDLMTDPRSGAHVELEELTHPDQSRRLAAVKAARNKRLQARPDRQLTEKTGSSISYFDLWVATRLADPHVQVMSSPVADAADLDSWFSAVAPSIGAKETINLAGNFGVSSSFFAWSGFSYLSTYGPIFPGYSRRLSEDESEERELKFLKEPLLEKKVVELEATDRVTAGEISATPTISVAKTASKYGSMALYNTAFYGTCSGGLNEYSEEISGDEAALVCPEYEDNLPARVAVVGVSPSPVEIVAAQTAVFSEPVAPSVETTPIVVYDTPSRDTDMVKMIAYEDNKYMLSKMSGKAVGPAWESKYAVKEPMMLKEEMLFARVPPRRLTEKEPRRHLLSVDAGVSAFCSRRRLQNEEQKQEERPEDRELAATGGMPSAYGSVLTKSGEYVIAFMGVKSVTEPSMFMYTMLQTPVYADWMGTVVVTTEGYALYLGQMIYCMSVLTAGMEAPYVTGHSLGGSAAALYASLGVSPGAFLVTFGSSPMFPKSAYTTGVSPVGSMYVKMFDLSTAKNTGGDTFTYPFGVYPSSVRFFHKFDPIPSDLLWGSAWVHATEKAYLLSDTPGCKSTPSCGGGKLSYKMKRRLSSKLSMPSLSELYSFVCTDYDVQTSSQAFGASTGAMYYSYFTFFNPFPCADVVISETYKYLDAELDWYGPTPFVTYETMEECTTSYTGTVDAYYATFLGANMIDVRTIDLEDEGDVTQMLAYYTNFGLGYVHSTYPFYALGCTYGEKMTPSKAAVTAPVPKFITAENKEEEFEAFMDKYA